jgi:cyclopropane fatty-acyl-phospholipid synthase-like methyltransferase
VAVIGAGVAAVQAILMSHERLLATKHSYGRLLGFDETFPRTWESYLAYCQAGFAAGYLDVAQIRFERGSAAPTAA